MLCIHFFLHKDSHAICGHFHNLQELLFFHMCESGDGHHLDTDGNKLAKDTSRPSQSTGYLTDFICVFIRSEQSNIACLKPVPLSDIYCRL